MKNNSANSRSAFDDAEVVSGYFSSDHWNSFLRELEGDVWHSHIYADISVHPDSLNRIFEAFFECRGQPLRRAIDYLTPSSSSDIAALHNIHPDGLPHFDFFFRFKDGLAISPMPPEEGQDGRNTLHWGKAELNDFYAKFPFRAVGFDEEKEIRAYFSSRHWKRTLNMILDPDIIHLHCNLVINFDPKILELIAREALAAQGWTLDKVVPNIFSVNGNYKGKLVFLGTHPERVYDIGWEFDPETVISPASEPWSRDDVPVGFDLCFTSEFNALVEKYAPRRMTENEIAAVISTFG